MKSAISGTLSGSLYGFVKDYISHSVKIVKKVEIYKSIDLFIYQKHSKITLFTVFGLGGFFSSNYLENCIKKEGRSPLFVVSLSLLKNVDSFAFSLHMILLSGNLLQEIWRGV